MTESSAEISFLEPEHLRKRLARGEELVIIDVRSPEEFAAGHIDGAMNIPVDQLNTHVGKFAKDDDIVTVCNHGGPRSCTAAEKLRAMGYAKSLPLRGGLKGFDKD
jgi:rhodanese-related sulfurtransferase